MARKTDVERGWEAWDTWILEEILKYKTRFVHLCYKAIMPKELYDLAKNGNEMDRCEKWAKHEGFKFVERGESTLLRKDGAIIAEFRPIFNGGLKDPHLEFYANIANVQINLVTDADLNT